ALRDVHSRFVMHRDLKPENIFISNNGYIVLGDFGLAHVCRSEHELHITGSAGTIPYAAPEVFESMGVYSFEADRYSLGVIAYQMFIG
ncbi:kinase-like domain-containing protein, partial [Cyathus striatus]